jgi:RND family efflux transporter MFP subunit
MIASMKRFLPIQALVLATAIACGNSEAQTPEAAAPEAPDLTKVVNVKAEQLKPAEFVSYYTVIGTVKANRDVVLSAESAGRVLRHYKHKGDRVKTGEVIAKIDDTLLKAEMERMLAQNRQSKENFERIGRLWNEEKVGSEMDFLNSKYAFEQSTAALASMNEQLERTNLKAPFDGVVDDLITEQGASVAMGTPVVRLIQDDLMKVAGGVPARFAGVVSSGSPVRIEIRNGQVLQYRSFVSYVSTVIDPKARTFRIEVTIPNNDHHLKVDAEASMTIETERISRAIAINQEYIGRNELGNIVYVVEERDGKTYARARQVVLGPTSENRTVILSGINTNDLVITEGFTYMEDQIRIRLVQTGEAENS